MKVTFSKTAKQSLQLLILPLYKEDLASKSLPKSLKDLLKQSNFSAESAKVLSTFISDKSLPSQLLFVGAGSKKEFNGTLARELGGTAARHAMQLKKTEVAIEFSEDLAVYLEEFLEGFFLRQYELNSYKTTKQTSHKVNTLQLIIQKATKAHRDALKRAELLNQAAVLVRDLVNGPSNIINSEYLSKLASKIAKDNSFKKIILGKKELTKMKAGGILAVNQGSKSDPKLLVLQYDGGPKKEKPIVLVGKGVIFDTGGYNLKRSGAIEDMHQDMAGAATVLGVMSIIKQLGIKKNVIAITPVVENLINEEAYRPADVITMLSGNTVEITNTDAEGRMILADALHYASEIDPQSIISIATLTGASFVALGHRYCALLGNDDLMRADIQVASKETDELAWSLPIHPDYDKEMNSQIADFRNYDLGSGGGAGTAKAAAFLEKFVGNKKWCHLDIGGTAMTTRPRPYQVKGATAHGLRILLRYLENQQS